ncbi:hypothetical protein C922_04448 [Plasmodium inui San Antonio 1]|uniref:Uncharacterized protein n=1 Tax=Plasmodium inui San Antonio 1 TaxID=1237626 RepID=W6ZWJ3_9APIC|nr:hypothetical protein C922_04448 [Plasmodium inui San Antonio 1]EUD65162.1 hypothetical protein C922_04448 [Plasmodium inui San Antonio 1]
MKRTAQLKELPGQQGGRISKKATHRRQKNKQLKKGTSTLCLATPKVRKRQIEGEGRTTKVLSMVPELRHGQPPEPRQESPNRQPPRNIPLLRGGKVINEGPRTKMISMRIQDGGGLHGLTVANRIQLV